MKLSNEEVAMWGRKKRFAVGDEPIELSELIKYLTDQLSQAHVAAREKYTLSLDECSLEMNVTVKKDAKTGIKAYVVELGAGVASESTHKVTTKFKPFKPGDDVGHAYETGTDAMPENVVLGGAKKG
jgi:Trypsin-co-occurring domain 2